MRSSLRPRNGFLGRTMGLAVVPAVLAGLAGTPAVRAGEPDPESPARPARPDAPAVEYLAADHPVWDDVDALANRAALRGLPLRSRPLPRLDVARAVARMLRERPGLASTVSARRLVRELAFELDALRRGGVAVPDTPPETRPPFELADEGVRLRAGLEARLGATTTGDEGTVPEGTRAIAVARAWTPGGAFVRAELALEKIEDGNDLGDSIVKNSPWYLAVEEAYVAFRPGGFEVTAGLLEHRWGPGTTGTLLLSDAAISYPQVAWARTVGERARFVAVTGALHAPQRKWFSAHRLEVAFGRRLRVGVHEAAAYPSDGLDVLYAVGLVPYTLVQRILDRSTPAGASARSHRNNVLVGSDVTWWIGGGWRVDGELLLDDLATESASQPDRIGWQAGAAWGGSVAGRATDLRVEWTKVRRWTYAVFYDADFVLDGTPLGYGPGPDVEAGTLRLETDAWGLTRAGVGVDVRRRGASPVGEAWEPDAGGARDSGSTLTEPVERRIFPHVRVSGQWRDVARFGARIGWERVENRGHVRGDDGDALRTEADLRLRW